MMPPFKVICLLGQLGFTLVVSDRQNNSGLNKSSLSQSTSPKTGSQGLEWHTLLSGTSGPPYIYGCICLYCLPLPKNTTSPRTMTVAPTVTSSF